MQLSIILIGVVYAKGFIYGQKQSWETQHDELCRVNDRYFTGIRIFHERTFPTTTDHKHTLVMECTSGLSVAHTTLKANESLFNTELHLLPTQNKTIQLIKRAEYQNQTGLKFVPGTVIGGVYFKQLNYTEWQPLNLLVSEDWSTPQLKTELGGIQLITPLLRTPDRIEKFYPSNTKWTASIKPN